jgi:hypothetical protein
MKDDVGSADNPADCLDRSVQHHDLAGPDAEGFEALN